MTAGSPRPSFDRPASWSPPEMDGAIITWNLGDWSADLPGRLVLPDAAAHEPAERTVTLEQSDAGRQHVIAEVAPTGIDPVTFRFSVERSTN